MKVIRQLWHILAPRRRIEGAILLCGLALGALFEALSIGLIIPFIAVLKDPAVVLQAPAAEWFLSVLGIGDAQSLIIAFAVALFGAFVLKSSYLMFLYNCLYRYAFDEQASLSRRLLIGYLNMPYPFHLRRNTSELIKVTTETTQRFTAFLISLLTVFGEVLVILALIFLLLAVDPQATTGAVLVLAVPAVLIYWSMQRRLGEAGRVAEGSVGAMIQWTEQALGGIKEALVMDRAGFFADRHAEQARRFANAQRVVMFLSGVPRLVMETLAVSAMIAIALIILMRERDMQSLLPVFGMFAVAAIRLMPSAVRVSSGLAHLRFHGAATEVLYNELRELYGCRMSGAPSHARDLASRMPFRRSLVLEHLSYRYPLMEQPAANDLSLEIPRGHWVGFIGPTGAGKTTLVDLILGLLTPTSGRILIDDRDLQDDVLGWQRNIGYVPQDIYLIDDTIRRNVAFGVADEDIEDERVWKALRASQADNFVRSMPDGLSALTGQRGERLSGGERQRLGIARALYRDPEVLVVDEATANLDSETEAAVVDTLARLRGDKTIIVIAHRLSVLSDCDCVYLLRQGRIQTSGRLSDLFSTDAVFREFAGSAP